MNSDLYLCDCANHENVFDHEDDCSLWYHDDFVNGAMGWDAASNQLIAADDYFNTDEPTGSGIDIIEMTLMEISDEDASKEQVDKIYESAVEYVGHEVLDVIDQILSGATALHPDEYDLLEEFAITVHKDFDSDEYPIYDCMCTGKIQSRCNECGVYQVDVDTKRKWIPTPSRIYQDVKMSLLGDIYECTCPAKAGGIFCHHCEVQRYSLNGTWTYFQPSKKTDAIDDNDWWTGQYAGTTTTWQKCRHYSQDVIFPDGTKIWASSSHDRKATEPEPDFGIYMYDSWPNHALAYKLSWTDYGLPIVTDQVVWTAAEHGLQMAREGKTVEIGCMGGHGRTGTFMAIMLLLAGFEGTPAEAVTWVHTNYCKEAIEGEIQEWYIAAMYAAYRSEPIPRKPCSYTDHKALFTANKTCDCNGWAKDYKSLNTPSTTTVTTIVNDNTPVPPPPTNGACSKYRHQVIWYRKNICTCKLWVNDVILFEKQPGIYKQRQGPALATKIS